MQAVIAHAEDLHCCLQPRPTKARIALSPWLLRRPRSQHELGVKSIVFSTTAIHQFVSLWDCGDSSMNETRDNPGVIAPPPLIALATLLLGLALDWFSPSVILRGFFGYRHPS